MGSRGAACAPGSPSVRAQRPAKTASWTATVSISASMSLVRRTVQVSPCSEVPAGASLETSVEPSSQRYQLVVGFIRWSASPIRVSQRTPSSKVTTTGTASSVSAPHVVSGAVGESKRIACFP